MWRVTWQCGHMTRGEGEKEYMYYTVKAFRNGSVINKMTWKPLCSTSISHFVEMTFSKKSSVAATDASDTSPSDPSLVSPSEAGGDGGSGFARDDFRILGARSDLERPVLPSSNLSVWSSAICLGVGSWPEPWQGNIFSVSDFGLMVPSSIMSVRSRSLCLGASSISGLRAFLGG